MNVSLQFEGHNVAYQCKGLDQSNIAITKLIQKSKTLTQNDKVVKEHC